MVKFEHLVSGQLWRLCWNLKGYARPSLRLQKFWFLRTSNPTPIKMVGQPPIVVTPHSHSYLCTVRAHMAVELACAPTGTVLCLSFQIEFH